MKIFKMNDCDWFLANSRTEAIVCYLRGIGMNVANDPDEEELKHFEGAEIDGVREMTEPELDSTTFTDGFDADTYQPINRTFREQLARELAEDATTPRFFASTEF